MPVLCTEVGVEVLNASFCSGKACSSCVSRGAFNRLLRSKLPFPFQIPCSASEAYSGLAPAFGALPISLQIREG